MLSAGFYYKTFMWPASFWEKVYEPLIRRAAGLGRASGESDPDTYEKAFLHCDVLVVGGGAGRADGGAGGGPHRRAGRPVRRGLPARRAAARRIAWSWASAARREWAAHIAAELAALPDVRIMPRTTVVGVYDDGTYSALERVNDHLAEPPEHEPRQRLWRIVAKRCVLAAGAIERPLVFGDNDRPGVMLAGAVRAYLNRYAAAPGRSAVVFAAGDETARTVGDLSRAGVRVEAIVDPRARGAGQHRGCRQGVRMRGCSRAAPSCARSARTRVRAVDVRTAKGETERIACDLARRVRRLEPDACI